MFPQVPAPRHTSHSEFVFVGDTWVVSDQCHVVASGARLGSTALRGKPSLAQTQASGPSAGAFLPSPLGPLPVLSSEKKSSKGHCPCEGQCSAGTVQGPPALWRRWATLEEEELSGAPH